MGKVELVSELGQGSQAPGRGSGRQRVQVVSAKPPGSSCPCILLDLCSAGAFQSDVTQQSGIAFPGPGNKAITPQHRPGEQTGGMQSPAHAVPHLPVEQSRCHMPCTHLHHEAMQQDRTGQTARAAARPPLPFPQMQPGHPEQGHCSAVGVPRCHPQGLEVPVGPWPERALSILHREIQTPPALRGSYHPPAAGLREGTRSRPCDVNRTGHCRNRRNCHVQLLDEVPHGLAASGLGRSLPRGWEWEAWWGGTQTDSQVCSPGRPAPLDCALLTQTGWKCWASSVQT